MGVTLVWVMIHEELKSDKVIDISQDSNGEWVLLLASICTVVSIISLVLIYQKELGDLRNI